MTTSFARSWLYVPGDRPERFQKALAASADGVILDLEDAVAPENKEHARTNVLGLLANAARGRCALAVRINSVETIAGMDDLLALARCDSQPDLVVMPKIEAADPLRLVDRLLRDAGRSTPISALIESARGVSVTSAIVDSCERLTTVMFGAADYCADLGQQVGTFRLDHARATIVNAAAMRGLTAIDSPSFGIDDLEGLRVDCEAAVNAGFFGKAAIHPAQIDQIHRSFTPSPQSRKRAKLILSLTGGGARAIEGRMVDAAMVRWARRVEGMLGDG